MPKGVRVVCGRCRRKLEELPWYSSQDFPDDERHVHGGGGRRWRCDRCGADWRVSAARWRTAYGLAGPGAVITLPI